MAKPIAEEDVKGAWLWCMMRLGKCLEKAKAEHSQRRRQCECEEVGQGARVQLCALTPNLQVW